MCQAEALAMINLSNCSRRNKQYLFAEIINASSTTSNDSAVAKNSAGTDAGKVVDHVKVLKTIAECLDDLTQTK